MRPFYVTTPIYYVNDLPHIGHIQIAGAPGRHEPDVGEINYAWLLRRVDELGYVLGQEAAIAAYERSLALKPAQLLSSSASRHGE